MKAILLSPSVFTMLLLGISTVQADLNVVSLSTITTDLAKNIGGTHVKIEAIIKPGIDPHEFEPTPSDLRKVTKADLVLFTGKGMEGFLTKLEEADGVAGKFLNVGEAVPSLTMTEESRKVEDPHWWHSVSNMERAAETLEEAFKKADPANAGFYEEREKRFLDSCENLKRWIRVKLAELPRSKRKLVTSHDALQYFARDYGFTILPVMGVSTGDEPSSRHVKELIGIIRREGVKAVFFESIENSRAVNQIAVETGARTGGVLYSDGLGDTEASTYDSMMRHNVSTIVDGLK